MARSRYRRADAAAPRMRIIPFGGLDRGVAERELNLIQLGAIFEGEVYEGAPGIVRRDRLGIASHAAQNALRAEPAPQSPGLPCSRRGRHRSFRPCRHGNGPLASLFADQVHHAPAAVACWIWAKASRTASSRRSPQPTSTARMVRCRFPWFVAGSGAASSGLRLALREPSYRHLCRAAARRRSLGWPAPPPDRAVRYRQPPQPVFGRRRAPNSRWPARAPWIRGTPAMPAPWRA